MGQQPGDEDGTGEDPGPGPGWARRDPRLAGFAPGGEWVSRAPSAALAAVLEGVSGAGWRFPGASHEELMGAARAVQALESWVCAAKLGILRALIREDDEPLPGGGYHGDLPDGWSRSLTHEVSLALAMPAVSAEKLMWSAWDLQALLPGIGALLEDGTLTHPKARAVDDALGLLADKDRAAAEAMILPDLAGKTYGQVEKMAAQAAITVDPGSAERGREHAERTKACVVFRRGRSGTASLSGHDLPSAETLAAQAHVCARAEQYKDSGAFPEVLTDQLRAMAYLDLINNISAEDRIAAGQPGSGLGAPDYGTPADRRPDESGGDGDPEDLRPNDLGLDDLGLDDLGLDDLGLDDLVPDGQDANDPNMDAQSTEARNAEDDEGGSRVCPCGECDGSCWPAGDGGDGGDGGGDGGGGPGYDGPDDGGPDDGERGDDEPGTSYDEHTNHAGGRAAAPPPPPQTPSPSSPSPSSPWSASPTSPTPPKLTDLVVPLATLLGLARRPGESHGFGPLDPALCASLAALAAASPHTTACVTVTDENGYAIGHGCLRSGRRTAPLPGAPAPPLTALPSRLNLTITAARLTELTESARQTGQPGPPGVAPPGVAPPGIAPPTGWALARPGAPQQPGQPGDPDWCGTWALTLPSGLQYAVRLEPVPTHDCDHRRESKAYEPNDALRHLVQIRDYECTFPTCSRHARESDFEHAIPYHKGGRTCGCNAGARSRQCHQVKQTKGWKLTQPKPGWHQWQTPSGLVYLQGPKRYPA